MTIDLAVSLASIAGTLIMAVTLVLSMKSNRRDRDSMIAATAARDQKFTDDISHIELEAERAYQKAQEVADHVNERFKEIEARQQSGDITTAKIAVGVDHIIEGIEKLDAKLERHIREGDR